MASSNEFARKYGPWALVTGASDGIGEAFARELASKGLNLVVVARREERLSALASELRGKHGIEVRVHAADLASRSSASSVFDATRDLDVGLLVAAAGFGSSGPLLQADEQIEADMVEVNCAAPLRQCIHYGRLMQARGRGGIVLLSSLVAFQGTPRSANYSASKAYIQSLAEGVGAELEGSGVDVLAVAPGPVDSGFGRRADMNLGRAASPDDVARGALSALGRKRTVRPGALSKLLGWSLSTAPRALRVRIMGGIMGAMTKHQRSDAGQTSPARRPG
jgi:uncharacterized protein